MHAVMNLDLCSAAEITNEPVIVGSENLTNDIIPYVPQLYFTEPCLMVGGKLMTMPNHILESFW